MRPALALAALLALAPAFALSGCIDCANGPPVSARGITSAPSSAGLVGGFALDVLVTSGPDGSPLPGAGVVVYWSSKDVADWEGAFVEVTPGRVAVDPGSVDSTPEAKSVERAMTGDDGLAHFRIPKGRIFGVVAAKEGHTEEWIPAMAAGTDDNAAGITLPLYPQRIEGDLDATWGPGGASTGTVTSDNYLWDPHALPFANTSDAERAYAARIVELTVEIVWANGPLAAGDLGVGVGPEDDQPTLFEDDGENVGPGGQTESATFTVERLREGAALGSSGIKVGAASDSGYFAPQGMPYRIHVEALLDTARAAFAKCIGVGEPGRDDGLGGASVPAWGPIGAIIALVGVASLRSRRYRHDDPS